MLSAVVEDLYNEKSNLDYASTPLKSPIPPPNISDLSDRNAADRSSNRTTETSQTAQYSSVSRRIMEKSGWNGQGGIGRASDGIAAPLEATESVGRAGLGYVTQSGGVLQAKRASEERETPGEPVVRRNPTTTRKRPNEEEQFTVNAATLAALQKYTVPNVSESSVAKKK